MASTFSQSPETQFTQLLAAAHHAAREQERVLAIPAHSPLSSDAYPDVTLAKLRGWSRVQFDGTLHILLSSAGAPAAEALIRGMSEALSHVHHIVDEAAGGTSRRRALCLELGSVSALRENLAKFQKWMPSAEFAKHYSAQSVLDIDSRVASVRALHDAEHCGCKGRTYVNASKTLVEMSKRYKDWSIIAAWVATSTAAHGNLPSIFISPAGQGLGVIGGATTYAYRARLLSQAISSFAITSLMVAAATKPAVTPTLKGIFRALQEHEILKAASSGQLDVP